MAEYVYGIVEAAAAAPRRAGIGEAPVRVLSCDGAAALVSDLPDREVQLGPQEILAHSRVLTDALEHGTVLPMRFGVVMEGSDQVRSELLEPHAAELRTQLERFGGAVELHVRVIYEEQALIRGIAAEDREIARLRDAVRGRPDDATYFDRITPGAPLRLEGGETGWLSSVQTAGATARVAVSSQGETRSSICAESYRSCSAVRSSPCSGSSMTTTAGGR